MAVVAELKRRRVFRSLAAYGFIAFALLQIVEPIMHGLHLPDSLLTVVVVVLGLGFPVVALFAWAFDLTGNGIERTPPALDLHHLRGAQLALLLIALGLLAATPGVAWILARRQAAPETPPLPSVAVLAFDDLSPGHDQGYFSEGLAEELLGALTQIEGLRVAGRASSFSFKDKHVDDVQTIAQKLHVTSVLQGSVRREGERLRVSAQLINAADGFNLWSETFDRKTTGVFEVQEEIAAAVVHALRVRLLPGQTMPVEHRTSPEAHRHYLLARQILNRGSADAFDRAVEGFEKAVALDPSYAAAWSGLALAAYYDANLARTPQDAEAQVRRALGAANQAVRAGPDLAETWAVRGWLRGLVDWDWDGAEKDMKEAVRLNPGDALVWRRYGFLLACLGRLDQALAAVRKSADLDPLAAEVWDNLGYLATAHGDWSEAREASKRALELAPEQAYAANHAAVADLLEGRADAALAAFSKSSEEIFRLQGVAMAAHALRRDPEADAAMSELKAKYAHNQAFQIAQAYAFRGDLDAAFEWLERAFRQRDGGMAFVACDPLLGKLRADGRYAQILKKMQLAVK